MRTLLRKLLWASWLPRLAEQPSTTDMEDVKEELGKVR